MSRTRIVLGTVAAVIVVSIPLLAMSCASARETAEAASVEFRTQWAGRAYDEIVGAATPEFQTTTSRVEFAKAMDALRERLGAWQSSEPPSWRVFVAGMSGQTVTLVYASRFERGAATEEFVWHVRRGQAALAGYHVKSSAVPAR